MVANMKLLQMHLLDLIQVCVMIKKWLKFKSVITVKLVYIS